MHVSLWWSSADSRNWVAVRDVRTDAGFVLAVLAGERARDVFDHPYRYAARRGLPTTTRAAQPAAPPLPWRKLRDDRDVVAGEPAAHRADQDLADGKRDFGVHRVGLPGAGHIPGDRDGRGGSIRRGPTRLVGCRDDRSRIHRHRQPAAGQPPPPPPRPPGRERTPHELPPPPPPAG